MLVGYKRFLVGQRQPRCRPIRRTRDPHIPQLAGQRSAWWRVREYIKASKSALIFLFEQTLGRDLAFLDHSQATKPKKLPVVLSRLKSFGIRRYLTGTPS